MPSDNVNIMALPPPAVATVKSAAGTSTSSPPAKTSKSAATGQSGTPAPDVARSGAADQDSELAQAVHNINQHIQNSNRNLEFTVDKESGQTVVRIVDAKSHEVIRQIPSEEALNISRRIKEFADGRKGLILQERV